MELWDALRHEPHGPVSFGENEKRRDQNPQETSENVPIGLFFFFPGGKKICLDFPDGKILFLTEQNFVPCGKDQKKKISVRKKSLFRGKKACSPTPDHKIFLRKHGKKICSAERKYSQSFRTEQTFVPHGTNLCSAEKMCKFIFRAGNYFGPKAIWKNFRSLQRTSAFRDRSVFVTPPFHF